MTTFTRNHSSALLSVVLVLALLSATQLVQAFGPYSTVLAVSPLKTTNTETPPTTTQLSMASWSLPAPIQNRLSTSTYWYENCGSCVARQVVYNDEHEDYFDLMEDAAGADGSGLVGFARLRTAGFKEARASDNQEDGVVRTTGGPLPLRVLRGVWKRFRGGNNRAK